MHMTALHRQQHDPVDSFWQPGAGMVVKETGGVQACGPGCAMRDAAG